MPNQTVLIIGFVWPEPNSSAAGSRMMQLITFFQKQHWKVTFASTASDSDYMADLESVNVDKRNISLNSSTFDAFISELSPSIVLFDRFMTEEQFGWRVAHHCPNALRILDTEDLHCLRRARHQAQKENREFAASDLLIEEVAKREIASILRSDISLIISEFEMELLQETFKVDVSLLHYLPLFSEPATTFPPWTDRSGFVFIGNFLHEPNKDAVFYLKEKIWPLIRQQLPDVNMNVYGAYPPQSILQLHNPKEKFFVHGRAKSAVDVIQHSRVMLAPLRFGAGIKGKLLEAMAYATPSITTKIGSEAMHGDMPWNGFVSDKAEEIASASVNFYQDELAWAQAKQNGFNILNARHLPTRFEGKFIAKIENVIHQLNQHRRNNFTGAMLQHHTMRSTEFLSRWIEEKNK